ncbi:MAG: hypothetical protein HC897_09590, partial [Thermoanaerobaculia bacterium]|nr:hypothetical protein [Thermoanaerobaculia bacterium]
MDLDLLASTAALLLKDALPHLHDLTSGTAKKMLETVAGEKAKEVAAALGLLKGKVEAKRLPKAALEDLAEEPQSNDALAALQQQLRKLLEQDEGLRAELLAGLEGAQVQVGERGLAVLGNLHAEQVTTGDRNLLIRVVNGNVYVNQPPAPATADTDLRRRYLDWVIRKTRHVALGAVDPRHTQGRQLSLATIYTALRTKTPREAEKAKREPELMREPQPPYSALEQLDLHPRLVLLGEPGSGKSTFLAFVALCLAAADLELLTSPLPNDDGSEGEQRQPWRHGALLPVRVVLRDFAVKAKEATAQEVWEFIERELAAEDFAAVGPLVKEALERGEALVLFDGLDEVPEAKQRRHLICRAVERFAERWEKSRMVVTSRTYAYQKQDFFLADFEVSELAPFGPGQIRRFIAHWYAERAGVEDWKEHEARSRGAQLERAIFTSESIRELAQRPLLLTLMASLHATRGSLPDDREKLYADTVELLLDVWEERRRPQGVGGEGEPSLMAWLGCDRGAVRQAIEELAYEAHAGQPEILGTADLDEDKLVGRLMRCDTKGSDPRELVVYLRERAGLLDARGPEVYTFPHRTFQEYLAACHLDSGRFDADQVAGMARRDPNRWREVVLLMAAKTGGTTRWSLIEELCFKHADEPCSAEEEWGALLAGQAAAALEVMSR